jgi:hypothetical protein
MIQFVYMKILEWLKVVSFVAKYCTVRAYNNEIGNTNDVSNLIVHQTGQLLWCFDGLIERTFLQRKFIIFCRVKPLLWDTWLVAIYLLEHRILIFDYKCLLQL